MKITVLTSNLDHPIMSYIKKWVEKHSQNHQISICTNFDDLQTGDFLFLISFLKKVPSEIRDFFKYSLVIHGSDLPHGRGWSPLVWQILEGHNNITLTLFEAVDKIDAGKIWKKETISFEGHELFDEISNKFFQQEIKLMDFALENFSNIEPYEQEIFDGEYYQKRSPIDSEIKPSPFTNEEFELLRIADPNRYPAFFTFRNHKYKISLEKLD